MSYDKNQQELWKYYDPNGTDPTEEYLRLLNEQEEIKTTIVDVQTEQTNLGSRVTANETNITQNANEISLQATEITSLDGRLSTAESNITVNANNIELKVSESDYNGDTIVGLINVSSAGVRIQGDHIDLVGAVTVLSDITGNLGTITAGTLNAVTLNSVTINSINGTFEGALRAYDTFTVGPEISEVDNFLVSSGTFWFANSSANRYLSGNDIEITVGLETPTDLAVPNGDLSVGGSVTSNSVDTNDTFSNLLSCNEFNFNNTRRLTFNNGNSLKTYSTATYGFQCRDFLDTAHVPIEASDFVTVSKRDTKTEIKDLNVDSLDVIRGWKTRSYKRKVDVKELGEKAKERIGFIYEEMDESVQENNTGLSLYGMLTHCVKAIQELDRRTHDGGKS